MFLHRLNTSAERTRSDHRLFRSCREAHTCVMRSHTDEPAGLRLSPPWRGISFPSGHPVNPPGRHHPTPVRNAVQYLRNDSGAATAEYAIATLAAVGLAALLVAILRGDEVRGMLTDIIRRALQSGQ